MEVGRKDIKTDYGSDVNIYFVGDIHEGNVNCDKDALKTAVKIILEDQNSYVIGMGDYIEAITIHDKRFDPIGIAKYYNIQDLKDLPYRQMEHLFKIISPIKDKFIALLMGNHEEAYVKYNSANVYNRFWDMFDNPDLCKLGYVGYMKIGLCFNGKAKDRPDQTIILALNHGDGGSGYLPGYPLNTVHKIFRFSNADVNIMGHLHKLVEDKQNWHGNITQSDRHVMKEKFYGMSGCFLRTYVQGNRNYFEHKGRSDSDIGMLRLNIKCKKKIEMKLEKVFL